MYTTILVYIQQYAKFQVIREKGNNNDQSISIFVMKLDYWASSWLICAQFLDCRIQHAVSSPTYLVLSSRQCVSGVMFPRDVYWPPEKNQRHTVHNLFSSFILMTDNNDDYLCRSAPQKWCDKDDTNATTATVAPITIPATRRGAWWVDTNTATAVARVKWDPWSARVAVLQASFSHWQKVTMMSLVPVRL